MNLNEISQENFNANDAIKIQKYIEKNASYYISEGERYSLDFAFFIDVASRMKVGGELVLLSKFIKLLDAFEISDSSEEKHKNYCLIGSLLYPLTEVDSNFDELFEYYCEKVILLSGGIAKALKNRPIEILPRHGTFELYAKYLFFKERYHEVDAVCEHARAQEWRGNWNKWKGKTVGEVKLSVKKATKVQKIGFDGEMAAIVKLKDMGYEVARFGKERKNSSLNHELLNIVPDTHVGLSHINIFKNNLGQKRGLGINISSENLEQNTYPKELDYTFEEFIELAKTCSSKYPCHLYQKDRKQAPCSLGRDLFNPISLDGLTPPLYTGHFHKCASIQKCQGRFGLISALQRGKIGSLNVTNQFLQDNIRVHLYIQKCFLEHQNSKKTPKDILDGGKKYKKLGHPGRYDFIAYNSEECVAVEVKANTSKLSYWQEMRLALLASFGQKVMVLSVVDNITNIITPQFNVELPTEEDFLSTLNYSHPSESPIKGVIGDTLITGYS